LCLCGAIERERMREKEKENTWRSYFFIFLAK
jgi:hypothetical protein